MAPAPLREYYPVDGWCDRDIYHADGNPGAMSSAMATERD